MGNVVWSLCFLLIFVGVGAFVVGLYSRYEILDLTKLNIGSG